MWRSAMARSIGSSWDLKQLGFWRPRCLPSKVMKLTSHRGQAVPGWD